MKRRMLTCLAILLGCASLDEDRPGLWPLYESVFKGCRYVDLTHAFSPGIAVWPGFGRAAFKPTRAGANMPGYIAKGQEFTYNAHGFIATAYELPTDQYGTQLDPPAHWDLCRNIFQIPQNAPALGDVLFW